MLMIFILLFKVNIFIDILIDSSIFITSWHFKYIRFGLKSPIHILLLIIKITLFIFNFANLAIKNNTRRYRYERKTIFNISTIKCFIASDNYCGEVWNSIRYTTRNKTKSISQFIGSTKACTIRAVAGNQILEGPGSRRAAKHFWNFHFKNPTWTLA